MPLSTALPPPVVEVVSRYQSPPSNTPNIGTAYNFQQVASGSVGSVAGPQETTVGATASIARRRERICADFTNNGNALFSIARSFIPSVPAPGYDGATGYNPGARNSPGAVVWVVNFGLAINVAGFGTDTQADGSGVWFLPADPGVSPTAQMPGQATSFGGFGCFVNSDGAGGSQLEYVSWNVGGAVLERITVPAAVIPDLLAWSTVRFILISAGSGRAATLGVQVNDEDVVVARPFGGGLLITNAAGGTLQPSWGIGARISIVNAATRRLFVTCDATFGRFTPDGREIQGP